MAFGHLRLSGCRRLCVSRLDIACRYLDAEGLYFWSRTAVVYELEGEVVGCFLIFY